jgi:hypothetical protein
VVTSRYPFKTCGPDCSAAVCNRGYAVFMSPAVCCEVSFPDGGCTRRPSQCWVVESFQLRTCVRDDRKCLQGAVVAAAAAPWRATLAHAPTRACARAVTCAAPLNARVCPAQPHPPPLHTSGYGVYASEAACCAPGPGGAFPAGCANVTKAAEPCWVPDTYWPTRQCRTSRTLCGAGEAHEHGCHSVWLLAACCLPLPACAVWGSAGEELALSPPSFFCHPPPTTPRRLWSARLCQPYGVLRRQHGRVWRGLLHHDAASAVLGG